MTKPTIAIIGAGISGITLANNLKEIAQVKIFEKSRGVAGRMSTRYFEEFSFDHGAQCFTARTREFQSFLQNFIESGDVAPWLGKAINIDGEKISTRFWFETHLVACPNMNSLCKKMAKGLDIECEIEIAEVEKENNLWKLKSKNGDYLGLFDLIISTAPPKQTKKLFGKYFDFKEITMQPCFSLMIGFKEKWQNDWIFAKTKNNPIKSIAVNSSKPNRNSEVTSLVIQTKKSWSTQNVDLNPKEVEKILLDNFSKLTNINYTKAHYVSLHRWLYALINEERGEIFFDQKNTLAATGDWVCDSRIEDVWIAANKLSEMIKSFYNENTNSG
ncbi:MAG: FAD-dependent oxidoreductase [Rickettsiales bacterium]|nr:FAD-dependent oxidoreductase [Rickettsiales bacterium]